MDNRKISLCVPTYNRYDLTLEAIASAVHDDRVDEIIVSDDASDLVVFNQLKAALSCFKKVVLSRNATNQDCYFNKFTAISLAKNDWVIIFDSDNKFGKDYIDTLYGIETWHHKLIYQPDFAKPNFDFQAFSGHSYNANAVAHNLRNGNFSTMLNAMNYFVNKHEYMSAFNRDVNPNTADSIFHNYNMLKNGCEIYVVPNLQYEHLVHDGSHYKNNNHKTGNFYNEVEQMILNLKN